MTTAAILMTGALIIAGFLIFGSILALWLICRDGGCDE